MCNDQFSLTQLDHNATSLVYPNTSFQLNYQPAWQHLHGMGGQLRSDTCISYWPQPCSQQPLPEAPSYRCLQEKPLHKDQFSFMINFLETYKDQPSFAVIHLCEYSHDDQNLTPHYDSDLALMLASLSSSGALRDTFFVLMGDHGFRAGSPFSKTPQGKLEDTMPMLAILPPRSLETDHPDMAANLKENAKVLTSHTDINMMLRQLLSLGTGLGEEQLFPAMHTVQVQGVQGGSIAMAGDPGTSLLRPVGQRDCLEVGIPMEYGSCAGGNFYYLPS